MAKVKMQHYVPQFYLKYFGVKTRSNKYRLYCYDKIDDRIFPASPRNVAGEKFFYDIPNSSEQIFETFYRKIESPYHIIHKKICKFEDLTILNSYERAIVSLFVTSQELRTLEFRKLIESRTVELRKKLRERGLELNPDLKKEIDNALEPEFLKHQQLASISIIPEFSTYIFQMKWILMKNDLDHAFLTSDNPIVRFNPNEHNFFGNLGLLSPGIRLHYPLSPRLMLIFCDPIQYAPFPSIINVNIKDNVFFENSLQVIHSTRTIFSNNRDFSLARRILDKNPEYRDLNRKRVNLQ